MERNQTVVVTLGENSLDVLILRVGPHPPYSLRLVGELGFLSSRVKGSPRLFF